MSLFDRDRLSELKQLAITRDWKNLPMGDLVAQVAYSFLGTPYVAGTLDTDPTTEKCIVDLAGLDCVTLFENALCIARLIKRDSLSLDKLVKEVTFTRYRGGKLAGYASRLHYTTEWFVDNEAKGVLDIVSLPGSEVFEKRIDFMSTHPDSYKQLKGNASAIAAIKAHEDKLNSRLLWHVPKSKVAQIESKLKSGDILGITTSIDGLDCTHTGLCYRNRRGVLCLLHASTTAKKVIVDVRLSDYLAKNSKQIGIMVGRPVDPLL